MEVGWWALLVSLGSLVVSGATFWRGRAPRPRWSVGVMIVTAPNGKREVTASATNLGKGVAHEVTFDRENAGLMSILSRQKVDQAEFGRRIEVRFIFDRDAQGDGAFVLKWRQEPNLHRLRTKRVRFKLEAIPDPNSRRGQRKR